MRHCAHWNCFFSKIPYVASSIILTSMARVGFRARAKSHIGRAFSCRRRLLVILWILVMDFCLCNQFLQVSGNRDGYHRAPSLGADVTNLSSTMILLASAIWHSMPRRRQLVHGSVPEHLILLCRQAMHLGFEDLRGYSYLSHGIGDLTRLTSVWAYMAQLASVSP